MVRYTHINMSVDILCNHIHERDKVIKTLHGYIYMYMCIECREENIITLNINYA